MGGTTNVGTRRVNTRVTSHPFYIPLSAHCPSRSRRALSKRRLLCWCEDRIRPNISAPSSLDTVAAERDHVCGVVVVASSMVVVSSAGSISCSPLITAQRRYTAADYVLLVYKKLHLISYRSVSIPYPQSSTQPRH